MGAATSGGCLAGLFAAGERAPATSAAAKGAAPDELMSPASQCSTAVAESTSATDESSEDDDGQESAKRLESGQEPASTPATPAAVKPKQSAVPQESAVIIFDWDDTLLPTSQFTGCEHSFEWRGTLESTSLLPSEAPEAVDDRDEASAAIANKRQEVDDHGALVCETLRAARKLGRVFIVTLSARPWVPDSAKKYLPGVDISALLDELDITVFYANESVACPGEGVAQFVAQKRCAMTKCMNANYNGRGRVAKRRNVLSIGDSDIEQVALKEVLDQWGRFRPPAQKPRAKTVKLRVKPSVVELGEQLRFINCRLAKIVAKDCDFHFTIDESTDLATAALELSES